jgi:hypothetical protein
MMHHVPQAGLAALAVAGPVERVVRRHCALAQFAPAAAPQLDQVEQAQLGGAIRQCGTSDFDDATSLRGVK